MLTLYRQEIFKLSKRKSPLMAMGILAVFNLLVAIVIKLNGKMFNADGVFAANFLSTWLVALLLIGATATIVTSEFEYNTIKNIIYQAGSRQRVLVSKWLATLTYMVFLYAYMLVLNLFLKLILFNTNFSLSDKDG
ncbi:ABC transporter permease, partial [Ligilactobacillus agilis]